MTDAERLHDIEQKLRYWGYLSHHSDAERDVVWLLHKLAKRDACRISPARTYFTAFRNHTHELS